MLRESNWIDWSDRSNHELVGVAAFEIGQSQMLIWFDCKFPGGIGGVFCFSCPPVSYKVNIHWLLCDCDFMIYDPETKELLRERVADGPLAEELCILQGTKRYLVGLSKLSICQGLLWIGRTLNGRVRVFRLVNGIWGLEHDVDAFNEMHWSSSSVQQELPNGVPFIKFWTMHPSDPMIAYVSVDKSFLECNFRDQTIEMVSERQRPGNYWSNSSSYNTSLNY